ncbi:hypothetical protein AXX17_AT3G33570 [Arabidopsis thaliana]|uniref:Uncharacterized protein n=1 Tax=Arabidopsis thaliana TaxID=3702 RepID=A0A178V8N1_ARATH|nr:hypothetical protein AXX17_AT3G33570 [Arabidopsis thaliana]
MSIASGDHVDGDVPVELGTDYYRQLDDLPVLIKEDFRDLNGLFVPENAEVRPSPSRPRHGRGKVFEVAIRENMRSESRYLFMGLSASRTTLQFCGCRATKNQATPDENPGETCFSHELGRSFSTKHSLTAVFKCCQAPEGMEPHQRPLDCPKGYICLFESYFTECGLCIPNAVGIVILAAQERLVVHFDLFEEGSFHDLKRLPIIPFFRTLAFCTRGVLYSGHTCELPHYASQFDDDEELVCEDEPHVLVGEPVHEGSAEETETVDVCVVKPDVPSLDRAAEVATPRTGKKEMSQTNRMVGFYEKKVREVIRERDLLKFALETTRKSLAMYRADRHYGQGKASGFDLEVKLLKEALKLRRLKNDVVNNRLIDNDKVKTMHSASNETGSRTAVGLSEGDWFSIVERKCATTDPSALYFRLSSIIFDGTDRISTCHQTAHYHVNRLLGNGCFIMHWCIATSLGGVPVAVGQLLDLALYGQALVAFSSSILIYRLALCKASSKVDGRAVIRSFRNRDLKLNAFCRSPIAASSGMAMFETTFLNPSTKGSERFWEVTCSMTRASIPSVVRASWLSSRSRMV